MTSDAMIEEWDDMPGEKRMNGHRQPAAQKLRVYHCQRCGKRVEPEAVEDGEGFQFCFRCQDDDE
jgi:formamidopyrimidine-DNA glycosylase